jgi:hypothetical protein
MSKITGSNNIALNDLHLFDLHNLQWITVVLFASGPEPLPLSRWGCSLVSADFAGGIGSGDTIMMFGGLNTKNYCEGCVIHQFILDPKSIAQSYDDSALKVKSIMSKAKETVPGEGNDESPATAR